MMKCITKKLIDHNLTINFAIAAVTNYFGIHTGITPVYTLHIVAVSCDGL